MNELLDRSSKNHMIINSKKTKERFQEVTRTTLPKTLCW